MFEISALKEKKIAELQEIASKLGIDKITGLKKIDLAYKIIDHYAVNPSIAKDEKKLEITVLDLSFNVSYQRNDWSNVNSETFNDHLSAISYAKKLAKQNGLKYIPFTSRYDSDLNEFNNLVLKS